MKINNEKGITLIALVITVVILTILGSISLIIVNNSDKTSIDIREKAELNMIQQLILERYTKYDLTKNIKMLVGDIVSSENLPAQLKKLSQINLNEYDSTSAEKKYYMLYDHSSVAEKMYLKKLGIENTSNVYIVNYYTGEVMQLVTETVLSTSVEDRIVIKENDSTGNSLVVKVEDNNRYVIKQASDPDFPEPLYIYAYSQ